MRERINNLAVSVLIIVGAVLPAMAQKAAHPAPDAVVDTFKPTCFPLMVEHDVLFRQASEPQHSLASRIDWAKSGFAQADPILTPDTSYIFLLTEWATGGGKYTLKSSNWYVYQSDGKTLKQYHAEPTANKVLLPYGSKQVVFVGLQMLNPDDFPDFGDVPADATPAQVDETLKQYRDSALAQLRLWLNESPSSLINNSSAAKGTAENVSNLGALLGALAGISTKAGPTVALVALETKKVPIPRPVCFESQPIRTVKALPFDLNLSFTLNSGTPPAAATAAAKDTGPVNCFELHDKGCTIARTFGAVDKEWWDVNVGLSIPGVREPKFSFNDKAGNVATSVTRHTDVYGFISLYPLAYKFSKTSYWNPHIDIGLPFTGQPLHRPFFGMAEKIPGTEKVLKIPGFFYAGTCRLIETVPASLAAGAKTDAATFAGNLRQHIVWKGMYGVEFPVGSLLSKIGKK